MAKANKLYVQFTKGLITESSPLTCPEGATTDELNMDLLQSGARPRRYGLDYSGDLGLTISQASFASYSVSEYKWISANNAAGSDFLCLQIGPNLYIFNLAGSLQQTIDLTTLAVSGATSPQIYGNKVSFASGNGFLFCAAKYLEPFVITYTGSAFTATRLFVLIRDFVGLDDGLGPDVEPATLSDAHKYNLQNQGWLVGYNAQDGASVTYWTSFGAQSTQLTSAASVIDTFHTDVGRYPSNGKLWWWAQKTSFNIDPLALTNLPAGNITAPKGHYIVNAFYIDRSAVSAITGFTVESQPDRPVTVAYFAGRVWWGCKSTVYFSRVLDANKYYKANFCCMEADPTSQKISDLIATDGGTILLPDVGTINKLYPVGSGMLVFGTNGVWFIQGGSGAFSAVDFSVSKMSPIGMDAPQSVIEVDSQIFWMSYLGIQGMSQKNGIFGPIQGNFDKLSITQNTIQSYYVENIPENIRQDVKAVYDPSDNTVQWLFRNADVNSNMYNMVLSLSLNFQAFYPWEFSLFPTISPVVIGAFTPLTPTLVTKGTDIRPTQTTYLIARPDSTNWKFSFGQLTNTNFADFASYDGTGKGYTSFLESGFEILQDAERKKWLPYLFTYLRQTETGFTTSDGGLTYTPVNPSSCYMTVKWGWTDSATSNRWTTPVQIYVISRYPFVDSGDLSSFDNGESMVQRKNKIRGSGKALQFRFESSEIGKDFDLYGWATEYSGNPIP